MQHTLAGPFYKKYDIALIGALSACKHRVSDSLSLPSRGSFQLSITVLFSIGHQVVFRLGGWSPRLPTGFLVSDGTLDTASFKSVSLTGLLPTMATLPKVFCYRFKINSAVRNPGNIAISGLASFPFARRYSGNRCFFLFLLLLRCFSSEGFLRTAMDSLYGVTVLP